MDSNHIIARFWKFRNLLSSQSHARKLWKADRSLKITEHSGDTFANWLDSLLGLAPADGHETVKRLCAARDAAYQIQRGHELEVLADATERSNALVAEPVSFGLMNLAAAINQNAGAIPEEKALAAEAWNGKD